MRSPRPNQKRRSTDAIADESLRARTHRRRLAPLQETAGTERSQEGTASESITRSPARPDGEPSCAAKVPSARVRQRPPRCRAGKASLKVTSLDRTIWPGSEREIIIAHRRCQRGAPCAASDTNVRDTGLLPRRIRESQSAGAAGVRQGFPGPPRCPRPALASSVRWRSPVRGGAAPVGVGKLADPPRQQHDSPIFTEIERWRGVCQFCKKVADPPGKSRTGRRGSACGRPCWRCGHA